MLFLSSPFKTLCKHGLKKVNSLVFFLVIYCHVFSDELKWLVCLSLSKTGLVSSSWERQYFFTQGGNLMQQGRGEVAGGLVTDLDNCSVMAVDCDDRRFCFQVTSFDGKK